MEYGVLELKAPCLLALRSVYTSYISEDIYLCSLTIITRSRQSLMRMRKISKLHYVERLSEKWTAFL